MGTLNVGEVARSFQVETGHFGGSIGILVCRLKTISKRGTVMVSISNLNQIIFVTISGT